MPFSQKLRKLVHPDGWRSAWAGVRRLSYPLAARRFVETVDPAGLARIRERHGVADEKVQAAKYLDLGEWMPTNVRRVRDLRLRPAPPRRRVLDIGSGAGWFLHVVRELGHDGLGLDIDEEPIYRETFALLGAPRVIHRIEPFQPLPDLGAPFDVVTAHMTCFNRRADGSHWGLEEWDWFLRDLARHLAPGGRAHFDLNPLPDNSHMTPELRAFFLARGARVDRRRVDLAEG